MRDSSSFSPTTPPEHGDAHAGAMPADGDPGAVAARAARALCQAAGVDRIDAGIVLGSGWKPAVDILAPQQQRLAELPFDQVEGFAAPTAEGHGGSIIIARMPAKQAVEDAAGEPAGRVVALLTGRTHAYEGAPLWQVVHGVRTLAAAGAQAVVLTNAAGGLHEGMKVGETVVISDHINATFRSPLVGAEFVNMVDAYSPRLRQMLHAARPGLKEAVYAMMPGPQYETPAEIHMLRTVGVGLVGMSTVYETIAARAAGMEVLGLSLVTNLAAGVTGEPLNHEEVLAAGAAAAADCAALLKEVVMGL